MELASSPSAFHFRKNGNKGILDWSPFPCAPEHLGKHSAHHHTCQRPSCCQELKIQYFFSFNGIFENIFKSLLFIFLLPFFSPWLSILLTEYHITGVDCIRVTWMAVTMYNLPFQLHVLRHMIFFKFSPHDLQAGKKWTLRQQSSGLKMIWNEMFHIYKHC